MYNVCKELRLSYTLGIGINSRLSELSDDPLKQAVKDVDRTQQSQWDRAKNRDQFRSFSESHPGHRSPQRLLLVARH
jgi:hypothetical protein